MGDVVSTELGEVAHGLEEGLVGGDDHVLAEVAAHRDWHRVAKDHAEAPLVDGVLALWLGDLLLGLGDLLLYLLFTVIFILC